MSSIAEAKENIAAALEEAVGAKSALGGAKEAVGQAIDLFGAATAGSGHVRIQRVLGSYLAAIVDFEHAIKHLSDSQKDANSYARSLG